MGKSALVKILLTACALLIASPALGEDSAAPDDDRPLILRRIEAQRDAAEGDFAILAHNPTWIMPVTWQESPNQAPWAGTERKIENLEAAFQISLKVPVLWNLWSDDASLWAAYTQRSWWQAYNGEDSRPFRETNHEPEVFIDWMTDWEYLGLDQRLMRIGVSHVSNGRAEPLSRTFNRVYVAFIYEYGDIAWSFRPWYGIESGTYDEDNPDLQEYLGNFDLTAIWKNGDHEFSAMLRNNLDLEDNRGAVQLDWSFPLHGKVRGYVQIFNGYGESLLDYNDSITRIGVGVLLSGWL